MPFSRRRTHRSSAFSHGAGTQTRPGNSASRICFKSMLLTTIGASPKGRQVLDGRGSKSHTGRPVPTARDTHVVAELSVAQARTLVLRDQRGDFPRNGCAPLGKRVLKRYFPFANPYTAAITRCQPAGSSGLGIC